MSVESRDVQVVQMRFDIGDRRASSRLRDLSQRLEKKSRVSNTRYFCLQEALMESEQYIALVQGEDYMRQLPWESISKSLRRAVHAEGVATVSIACHSVARIVDTEAKYFAAMWRTGYLPGLHVDAYLSDIHAILFGFWLILLWFDGPHRATDVDMTRDFLLRRQ